MEISRDPKEYNLTVHHIIYFFSLLLQCLTVACIVNIKIKSKLKMPEEGPKKYF